MSAPLAGAVRVDAAPPLLPLALLLTVGTLLGVFAVLVKAAIAAGWHPLVFLFWALVGSGLIVLAVAVWRGQHPATDRRSLAYSAGAGFLSAALPNVLSFSAIAHVGAGFVALCYAFPPLITYCLALGLRMERPRMLRAAGLMVGLIGAVLLVAAKVSVEGESLGWLAIALAAPVVVASGNIFRSRFWPVGATPLSLAPGMLIAGALLLGPSLMIAGVSLAPPPNIDAVVLVLAEVAVFSAVFSLIFVLQALAGPVYLSQIGSVGAAAGAVLAVAFLGETASLMIAVAAAVILVGVALVNRTNPRGDQATARTGVTMPKTYRIIVTLSRNYSYPALAKLALPLPSQSRHFYPGLSRSPATRRMIAIWRQRHVGPGAILVDCWRRSRDGFGVAPDPLRASPGRVELRRLCLGGGRSAAA